MKVNFEIRDNYAVVYNSVLLDLHNNFSFVNYEYVASVRQFKLKFQKSEGEWANDVRINELTFVHKSVRFLFIDDKEERDSIENEMCLSDLSFFPGSDRNMSDSSIVQSIPELGDDILYFFQNVRILRIGCEEIELQAY